MLIMKNADGFFTARLCYHSPFGIIKIMIFFYELSCVLKCWQGIYIFMFLAYNTLRAIVGIFCQNFSSYLLLMGNSISF